MPRTVKISPADLRQRAGTAREHLQVALERLAYVDGQADPSAAAQVAASNAISAGVAAADAICGAVLGEHANDQDHRASVEVLATAKPGGLTLASRLRQLLKNKPMLQAAGALASSCPHCALIPAAGVLVLSGCASTPGVARPAPMSSASPGDPAAYAAQIVRETNDVRSTQGLPVLVSSKCAQDAELRRAVAVIGTVELTHAPLTGVIAGCVPATTAAEDLSKAASTPAAVIDAWMQSPGHRSNLLDPTLTEIGVGCVLDSKSMLCSQVFLGP